MTNRIKFKAFKFRQENDFKIFMKICDRSSNAVSSKNKKKKILSNLSKY